MLIELLIVDATDLHESWASGQSGSPQKIGFLPQRLPKQSCIPLQNSYYREYKYKFLSFQGIIN